MMRARYLLLLSFPVVVAPIAACDEIPEDAMGGGGTDDASGTGAATGTGGNPFQEAPYVDVDTTMGVAFVDLDTVAVVAETADWELKLEGLDVYTNGGVSGSGQSAAFGPQDDLLFLGSEVPGDIPFMIEDEPGGAFFDWYDYDGATHALYSRYHVIGVRRGDDLFKVQVLGYYGEEQGAPISALFQLRSARVGSGGSEATMTWENIDGTAGGTSPTDSDPSGCIVLATGSRLALTPAQAAASTEWDLCFRRDAISVNGGDGGPGGVEAVNLQAAEITSEALDEVKSRTAASEQAAFDAVGYAQLTVPGVDWRGDGVVSAFTGKWIDRSVEPYAPVSATWIVAGADGVTPFFVAFEKFEGASAASPGIVRIRVKKVGGNLP
ncbi:MAG: HmuY family protein [Myxococcales bacterium]|nr:HmuY family protein [Myxococcales bacterium]